MSLVRRFYPQRLTYSILWAIPTGAIWGEVSQGHNDMLTAVGFEPDQNTNALSTAPPATPNNNNYEVSTNALVSATISLLSFTSASHQVCCYGALVTQRKIVGKSCTVCPKKKKKQRPLLIESFKIIQTAYIYNLKMCCEQMHRLIVVIRGLSNYKDHFVLRTRLEKCLFLV